MGISGPFNLCRQQPEDRWPTVPRRPYLPTAAAQNPSPQATNTPSRCPQPSSHQGISHFPSAAAAATSGREEGREEEKNEGEEHEEEAAARRCLAAAKPPRRTTTAPLPPGRHKERRMPATSTPPLPLQGGRRLALSLHGLTSPRHYRSPCLALPSSKPPR